MPMKSLPPDVDGGDGLASVLAGEAVTSIAFVNSLLGTFPNASPWWFGAVEHMSGRPTSTSCQSITSFMAILSPTFNTILPQGSFLIPIGTRGFVVSVLASTRPVAG